MVKIKYNINNKDTLSSKFTDLVDDFEEIVDYYNDISIPSDLDKDDLLSTIYTLFNNVSSNVSLVEHSLKESVNELEEIQGVMLDELSMISVDNLPTFNFEVYKKNNNKSN